MRFVNKIWRAKKQRPKMKCKHDFFVYRFVYRFCLQLKYYISIHYIICKQCKR